MQAQLNRAPSSIHKLPNRYRAGESGSRCLAHFHPYRTEPTRRVESRWRPVASGKAAIHGAVRVMVVLASNLLPLFMM
jgi:hypothetical protein